MYVYDRGPCNKLIADRSRNTLQLTTCMNLQATLSHTVSAFIHTEALPPEISINSESQAIIYTTTLETQTKATSIIHLVYNYIHTMIPYFRKIHKSVVG